MGQVKEISVGFTCTKNLGNYESLKVDSGVVVTVDPGESEEEVYRKAWNIAKKQVTNGLAAGNGGF
jgi:hypothetical protein